MNKYLLLLINFFYILQNINAMSTISLRPKVAIVINGIYGVGGRISISLAKQGYDLIIHNNDNKYYNYDFIETLKKNYNTNIKIVKNDCYLKL